MKLPIDVVPGSVPPKFRWTNIIGEHRQVCEGMVQASMEASLVAMVNVAKQLMLENEELRKQVAGHCERIAAQSEVITKKAETPTKRK